MYQSPVPQVKETRYRIGLIIDNYEKHQEFKYTAQDIMMNNMIIIKK